MYGSLLKRGNSTFNSISTCNAVFISGFHSRRLVPKFKGSNTILGKPIAKEEGGGGQKHP